MKYIKVEGTSVHQSIKNKNTEVRKKCLGIYCTHSEQQCRTHPNSRLLKLNQEMHFLKARTVLCLTHFICCCHVQLCHFIDLSRSR